MNQDLRIVNAKNTTKAELIRLNTALAQECAELRNTVNDLSEALARKVAEPMLKRLFPQEETQTTTTLQQQAQAVARKMGVLTRVHNGEIEVRLHGGWNSLNAVAVPT